LSFYINIVLFLSNKLKVTDITGFIKITNKNNKKFKKKYININI